MGREGLLAFIRNTICPEANSNVKSEMRIESGRFRGVKFEAIRVAERG